MKRVIYLESDPLTVEHLVAFLGPARFNDCLKVSFLNERDRHVEIPALEYEYNELTIVVRGAEE